MYFHMIKYHSYLWTTLCA